MSKKIEEKFDLSSLTEVELAELAARANKIKEEMHLKNFPENVEKVREYINGLGLDLNEVLDALSNKPKRSYNKTGASVKVPVGEVIFEYKTHKKTGLKGGVKWADTLKKELEYEEALKYAVGDDGKTFVDRIYGKTPAAA